MRDYHVSPTVIAQARINAKRAWAKRRKNPAWLKQCAEAGRLGRSKANAARRQRRADRETNTQPQQRGAA